MKEVKKIRSTLEEIYYGPAWHGPALKELLKGVSAKKALVKQAKGSHSIWELVLHLTTWTEVAEKRVKGEKVPQVSSAKDWPSDADRTEKGWKKTLQRLDSHQKKLFQYLAKTKDSRLSEKVQKSGSRLDTLLYGTINHEMYHAGQIGALKKMIGEK
ncbi:MAG: DinB family protein [candidate division Zixibacteria bacterium]|nr:DinB family protein [candidate division Zixibacteria bacterium]